jgi:hypothetical protein
MGMRDQLRRPSSGLASVGVLGATALIAVAAMAASGNSRDVTHVLDGGAWLANSTVGSVSHAGPGGIDATVPLKAPVGRDVKVVQQGSHVYVEDQKGHLARIDPSELDVAQQATLGGDDVQVVTGGNDLWAVNPTTGSIRQLDPITLMAQGPAVALPAGLGTAVADPSGTLWVPVWSRGTVDTVDVEGSLTHTYQVATPGTHVQLSVVNGDVLSFDPSSASVHELTGPSVGSDQQVSINAGPGLEIPAAVTGSGVLPVVSPTQDELATVSVSGGQRIQVDLGHPGDNLGSPEVNDGQVYVPDYTTGQLLVVDVATGGMEPAVTITGQPGYFDVVVNDGELFVNQASSPNAWIVTAGNQVIPMGKYDPNGSGGAPVTTPPTTVPPKTPPTTTATPPTTSPSTTVPPNDRDTTTTTVPPGGGHGSGNGGPSLPVTPPIVITPGGSTSSASPDAAQAVLATAGDGTATVTWSAPASGPPAGGYQISVAGQKVTLDASDTSWTAKGLTNGSTYTFTVTVLGSSGVGPSVMSNPVVPGADVAGAPSGVTATASTGQAVVKWSAAPANGGTITGYSVTETTDGTVKLVNSPATSVTFSGLTNGVAYTFTVAALESGGTTGPSAASSAVTPTGPPSAPGNPVASAASSGSALVSWSVPSSNGGSPITGYTITASPGGTTLPVKGGSTTSATFSGLSNGTTYTFTVAAVNALGTGPAATTGQAAVNSGVPDAPGAPTATPATDGSITVSWSAPSGNGSTITGYTVTNLTTNQSVSTSSTSYDFPASGLSRGTSYSFSITATAKDGDTGTAAGTAAVTDEGPPGAPTSVSATTSGTAASVSFAPPAGAGGVEVSSFTVTASPGGATGSASASPITVSNLTPGTTYTFTVVADSSVAGVANSPASAPSAAVLVGAPPSAPALTSVVAKITINENTGEDINAGTADWTAATAPAGEAVTSYIFNPGDGEAPVTAGPTATTVSFTPTDVGTFTASLVAVDASGQSTASTLSYTVTETTIGRPNPCNESFVHSKAGHKGRHVIEAAFLTQAVCP